jgi:hypothetical protein
MARWLFAVIMAATIAAASPAWAVQASDKPVELRLRAVATIDPAGRITALEWDERREPVLRLARMLEPSVLQLRFDPGQVEGVPVETRTTLSLVVNLTGSDEEGMSASIAKASTGVAILEQTPVYYPPDAARTGQQAEVVLVIALDAAGEVTVEEASYIGTSDHAGLKQQFIAAASKSVSGWRYRVEELDGRPAPTRVAVTVAFCLNSRPAWCDGSERVARPPSGGAVVPHVESGVRVQGARAR